MAATALLLLSTPGLSTARNIEITPYAGYRASSALSSTTVQLSDGSMLENFDFESGAIFGLWFDYRVQNRLMIELTAEGFPSKVTGNELSSGESVDAFDVVLYYFQVGLHYEIIEYGVSAEDVKIRPFISGGLGSTVMDAEGNRSTNALLNFSFAVGFKFMLNDRLGLRTQGRYFWTYMNAANDYFCQPDGTGRGTQCVIFPTSESLNQIDITLGLIITL
ncbi:MAG: outer membrane beta-barrel protein [Candidatus Latescibacterota bacterium]|jgi:hypothetical protein